MTQSETPIALRDLVENLAAQLHILAVTGRDIEDSVGERIQNGASARSISGSLQALDHLVQVLEDLSVFLHGIVPAIDARSHLAAEGVGDSLRLRGLANALIQGGALADGLAHPAGDVDLF